MFGVAARSPVCRVQPSQANFNVQVFGRESMRNLNKHLLD
jgi:hypothetical protein